MRRLIFLLFLSLFIFCGCEGPMGPMGPEGADGGKGDKGDAGIPGGTTEFIESNTVWDADKYLNYNVFIDNSATLTINPGVTIYLYPNSSIYNYGKIIANGNAGNWIAIKFKMNSLYNSQLISYDGSSNIFSFCKFESLQNIEIIGGHLNLNNCIIRKSFLYGIISAGPPGTLRICNTDIMSNNFFGIDAGLSSSYVSNNYIAFNNGSLIVALSALATDPDTPKQYILLSQPRVSPRSTPNFP
jgi:hypothetical protein